LNNSQSLNTDLLATYSVLLVTEESAKQSPMTPSLDTSTWRYQARIPAIPVPGNPNHYSLLSHLRHLLAKDPDVESIGLHGGLNIMLYRNSVDIVVVANTARDDWHRSTNKRIIMHNVSVLDHQANVNTIITECTVI